MELLVVLAVIGLLAAQLLPALTGAKFQARNTVCRNNLRQLALTVATYASNEGVYPPLCVWISPGGQTGIDWRYILNASRMLSWDNKVHYCPLYRGIVYNPPSDLTMLLATNHSYGYNKTGVRRFNSALGLGGWSGVNPYSTLPNVTRPAKESDVKAPSDMIAFSDCAARTDSPAQPVEILNGESNPAPIPDFALTAYQYLPPYDRQPTFQAHRGRFNRSFCDAHVEGDNLNRFIRITNDYLKRFNIDNQPHWQEWASAP